MLMLSNIVVRYYRIVLLVLFLPSVGIAEPVAIIDEPQDEQMTIEDNEVPSQITEEGEEQNPEEEPPSSEENQPEDASTEEALAEDQQPQEEQDEPEAENEEAPAEDQAPVEVPSGVNVSEVVSGLLTNVNPVIASGLSLVLGQVIGNAAVSKTATFFGKKATVSLDSFQSAQSLGVKLALAQAIAIPLGQKTLSLSNLLFSRDGDTRKLTSTLSLAKPNDVSLSVGLGAQRVAELNIAELKFSELFPSVKDTPIGKLGLSDINITINNFLVAGAKPAVSFGAKIAWGNFGGLPLSENSLFSISGQLNLLGESSLTITVDKPLSLIPGMVEISNVKLALKLLRTAAVQVVDGESSDEDEPAKEEPPAGGSKKTGGAQLASKYSCSLSGDAKLSLPSPIGNAEISISSEIQNGQFFSFTGSLKKTFGFNGIVTLTDPSIEVSKSPVDKKLFVGVSAITKLGNEFEVKATLSIAADKTIKFSAESPDPDKEMRPLANIPGLGSLPLAKDLAMSGLKFQIDSKKQLIISGKVRLGGITTKGTFYNQGGVKVMKVGIDKMSDLGNLIPAIKGSPLESFNLSGTSIVFSSGDFTDPETMVEVKKGIAIMSSANLAAGMLAPLRTLLGMSPDTKVGFSGGFGGGGANFSLGIPGSTKIGSLTLAGISLSILLSPTAGVELGLAGRIRTTLPQQTEETEFVLQCALSASPTAPGVKLAASMVGEWQNPLGLSGLAIKNVAVEAEVAFLPPPPHPSGLGFTGTMEVGDKEFSVAVKASQKGEFLLNAELKGRLSFKDIPALAKHFGIPIPDVVSKAVPDIGLEDVQVYFAPKATSVGAIQFQQGLTIKGKVDQALLLGPLGVAAKAAGAPINGKVSLNISASMAGIIAEAQIDTLKFGEVFVIDGQGLQGQGRGASVSFRLTPSEQKFQVNGDITILGIKGKCNVLLNPSSAEFLVASEIDGKLSFKTIPQLARKYGAPIPSEVDIFFPEADLGSASMYFSSKEITVDGKKYPQGISIRARVPVGVLLGPAAKIVNSVISGKAFFELGIDKTGLVMKAGLPKIELGPKVGGNHLIEITGSGIDGIAGNEDDGPAFSLEISKSKQQVMITGESHILSGKGACELLLNPANEDFKLHAMVRTMLGKLEVNGQYFKNPSGKDDLLLTGELERGNFDWLPQKEVRTILAELNPIQKISLAFSGNEFLAGKLPKFTLDLSIMGCDMDPIVLQFDVKNPQDFVAAVGSQLVEKVAGAAAKCALQLPGKVLGAMGDGAQKAGKAISGAGDSVKGASKDVSKALGGGVVGDIGGGVLIGVGGALAGVGTGIEFAGKGLSIAGDAAGKAAAAAMDAANAAKNAALSIANSIGGALSGAISTVFSWFESESSKRDKRRRNTYNDFKARLVKDLTGDPSCKGFIQAQLTNLTGPYDDILNYYGGDRVAAMNNEILNAQYGNVTLPTLAVQLNRKDALVAIMNARGVNILTQNSKDGSLPLDVAIQLGYVDIVKELIRDPSIYSSDQASNAVRASLLVGNPAITKALLDTKLFKFDGFASLDKAVAANNVPFLQTVVKMQADAVNNPNPIDGGRNAVEITAPQISGFFGDPAYGMNKTLGIVTVHATPFNAPRVTILSNKDLQQKPGSIQQFAKQDKVAALVYGAFADVTQLFKDRQFFDQKTQKFSLSDFRQLGDPAPGREKRVTIIVIKDNIPVKKEFNTRSPLNWDLSDAKSLSVAGVFYGATKTALNPILSPQEAGTTLIDNLTNSVKIGSLEVATACGDPAPGIVKNLITVAMNLGPINEVNIYPLSNKDLQQKVGSVRAFPATEPVVAVVYGTFIDVTDIFKSSGYYDAAARKITLTGVYDNIFGNPINAYKKLTVIVLRDGKVDYKEFINNGNPPMNWDLSSSKNVEVLAAFYGTTRTTLNRTLGSISSNNTLIDHSANMACICEQDLLYLFGDPAVGIVKSLAVATFDPSKGNSGTITSFAYPATQKPLGFMQPFPQGQPIAALTYGASMDLTSSFVKNKYFDPIAKKIFISDALDGDRKGGRDKLFGKDPAPGRSKVVTVIALVDGVVQSKEFNDTTAISWDMSSAKTASLLGVFYGATRTMINQALNPLDPGNPINPATNSVKNAEVDLLPYFDGSLVNTMKVPTAYPLPAGNQRTMSIVTIVPNKKNAVTVYTTNDRLMGGFPPDKVNQLPATQKIHTVSYGAFLDVTKIFETKKFFDPVTKKLRIPDADDGDRKGGRDKLFGKDPAPGRPKKVVVVMLQDGVPQVKEFDDKAPVAWDFPPKTKAVSLSRALYGQGITLLNLALNPADPNGLIDGTKNTVKNAEPDIIGRLGDAAPGMQKNAAVVTYEANKTNAPQFWQVSGQEIGAARLGTTRSFSQNERVLMAIYGVYVDVTKIVLDNKFYDPKTKKLLIPDTKLFGDPAPGKPKKITVLMLRNGLPRMKEFDQGKAEWDMSKSKTVDLVYVFWGATSATYPNQKSPKDWSKLTKKRKNAIMNAEVDLISFFGDVAPGMQKELTVVTLNPSDARRTEIYTLPYKDLQQKTNSVIELPKYQKIIAALYGVCIDVTKVFNDSKFFDPTTKKILIPDAQDGDRKGGRDKLFGKDPAPGKPKKVTIVVWRDGFPYVKEFTDAQQVNWDLSASNEVQLVGAFYGVTKPASFMGVNPHVVDSNGNTLLLLALNIADVAAVKELLDIPGINYNQPARNGVTPLSLFAMQKDPAMIALWNSMLWVRKAEYGIKGKPLMDITNTVVTSWIGKGKLKVPKNIFETVGYCSDQPTVVPPPPVPAAQPGTVPGTPASAGQQPGKPAASPAPAPTPATPAAAQGTPAQSGKPGDVPVEVAKKITGAIPPKEPRILRLTLSVGPNVKTIELAEGKEEVIGVENFAALQEVPSEEPSAPEAEEDVAQEAEVIAGMSDEDKEMLAPGPTDESQPATEDDLDEESEE